MLSARDVNVLEKYRFQGRKCKFWKKPIDALEQALGGGMSQLQTGGFQLGAHC